MLPPRHKKVPERARVGQAGSFHRENVPGERNCYESVSAEGHQGARGHAPHLGLRAVQM